MSVSNVCVSSCSDAYSAFLLLLIYSASNVFLVAMMLIIRISCLCICYASSCSNVCNKDISVCVASAFQFVLINEVSVKILCFKMS